MDINPADQSGSALMKDEVFGVLKWNGDAWEGHVKVAKLSQWGAALDEKDPPDTRPAEKPDRSPTKKQLEAREKLAEITQQMGGEEGAALAGMMTGFLNRMEAAGNEPLEEEEIEDDEDMKALRQGLVTVQVEAKSARSKPSDAQRKAWEALLARGDAIWDELLKESFEIYKRQMPARRKWWQTIYGDYLLEKKFPKVKSIKEFSRLVRPFGFQVKQSIDKKDPSAEITLRVLATWEVDGLGVIIHDGKIVEFAQVIEIMGPSKANLETIKHPMFGHLRRIASDDAMEYIGEWEISGDGELGFENARRVTTRPWKGFVTFDPLLEYSMVSDMRAQYAHDRGNAEYPASRMAWEFANGEFEIRVYAANGEKPSKEQADAWTNFKKGEKKFAAEMIESIFQQYQETCAVKRDNYKDRYVGDNVPILKNKVGLRELIQLRHIHIHPADKNGQVAIAFQFVASYDYDGFTAFWRNGKFTDWGEWKDAAFQGFK